MKQLESTQHTSGEAQPAVLPLANKRILVVGLGKMGYAVTQAWLAQADVSGLSVENLCVLDPSVADKVSPDFVGAHLLSSSAELEGSFDVALLAVKPQKMAEVLHDLKLRGVLNESLVVSVAAGLTRDFYLNALKGVTNRVVRVMPNLCIQTGRGVSALCGQDLDVQIVHTLFSLLGKSVLVEEDQIDVIAALSGSGPAYVAALVEHLAFAGEQLGLDKTLSLDLAYETLIGTAYLMEAQHCSASQLRQAVSSPGGTTLAALASMQSEDIAGVYTRGLQAAYMRAKELLSRA